ncbi:MAG: hypothetical protein AAF384_04580 [Pseudomonadota bacterium]
MESEYKLSTDVLIGAPLQSTAKKRMKQLSSMLSDLDVVREAHLPEVRSLTQGIDGHLVLFVVVDDETDVSPIGRIVKTRLKKILGFREKLDVQIVTPDFDHLETVRQADCIIGWRD